MSQTKDDSLMSILLDMGYTFDSIQAYISSCNVHNIEPNVDKAVTFIDEYTNSPVMKDTPENESIQLVRQIESTIPTVLSSSGKTNIPRTNTSDPLPVLKSFKKHPPANSNTSLNNNEDCKKTKLAKKQFHQQVLTQIENDKLERHQHPRFFSTTTKTNQTDLNNNCTSSTFSASSSSTNNNYNDSSIGSIKIIIRLLDGRKVTYPAVQTDTLSSILNWLNEFHCDTTGCTLIQSFPFRKFTPEEFNLHMLEIGIIRDECLTLHKMDVDEKTAFGQSIQTPQVVNPLPPAQNALINPNPFLPNQQNVPALAQHDWGTQGAMSGGDYVRKIEFLKRFENANIHEIAPKYYNKIPSFQELILKLLMRYAMKNYLPHLKKLNPLLCSIVLQRLIHEQLLSPKIAESFIGCHLRTIDLTSCQHVTNELLSKLANIRHPKSLIIKGSPYLTNKGMKYIGEMATLEKLFLENCDKLTDFCVTFLGNLNSLKHVSFRNTKITDSGLKVLLEITSKGYVNNTLVTLDLGMTKVTNALSQCIIAKCDNLEKLDLNSLQINEMFPLEFALTECLINLKELDLSGCKFTQNANFYSLALMPKLTTLQLMNSSIPDFSFLENLNLKKISFPRKVVNLDNSSPFRYLKLFHLTELDLTNCMTVTDDSIEYLAEISQLKCLILRNVKTPIACSFKHLSSLTNLTLLDLEHTSIDDTYAILILKSLTSLIYLNLTGTKITDLLLTSQILNSIINLEYLNLNHNAITSQEIKYLSLLYLRIFLFNPTKLLEDERSTLINNCPSLSNI